MSSSIEILFTCLEGGGGEHFKDIVITKIKTELIILKKSNAQSMVF